MDGQLEGLLKNNFKLRNKCDAILQYSYILLGGIMAKKTKPSTKVMARK